MYALTEAVNKGLNLAPNWPSFRAHTLKDSDMPAAIDLTGARVGFLTAIRRVSPKGQKVVWECKCDCGSVIERSAAELRTALTKGTLSSCGCEKAVSRRKDWTGQKVNRLQVLWRVKGTTRWECRCDCGTLCEVSSQELAAGQKSCGCAKADIWKGRTPPNTGKPAATRKDWTGKKIGRLTFIRPTTRNSDGRLCWLAECECGNTTEVPPKAVVSGNTRSCGCLHKDMLRAASAERGRKAGATRQHTHIESLLGQTFGKLKVTGIQRRAVGTQTHLYAFASAVCECGTEVEVRTDGLKAGKVVTCGCGSSVSQEEIALYDWVKAAVGGKVLSQHRVDGWIFDIALPEHKLLIEYNGVYWHSARFVANDRKHLVKRRAAEDAGWTVINIWSDSWAEDPDRYRDLILRRCGKLSVRTIGARKIAFQPVEPETAYRMHTDHHVQKGRMPASEHIGAYVADELVAVISVQAGVIVRMTVKRGYTIPGLLARFMANRPERRWVTYCDRDHFTGSIYAQAGFRLTTTSVQMSYVSEQGIRMRREHFMKSKLEARFGLVDLTKTERTICAENGVYAVFNSGIDRWEWNP